MTGYQFRGFTIEQHMLDRLNAYIDHGEAVGHFLTAVLENNLKEAVGRADDENMATCPPTLATSTTWLTRDATVRPQKSGNGTWPKPWNTCKTSKCNKHQTAKGGKSSTQKRTNCTAHSIKKKMPLQGPG